MTFVNKHLKTIIVIFLVVVVCSALPTRAGVQTDTLRIATYNLLKFPSKNGAGRLDDFRKVIKLLQPDILVVQELESNSGLQSLLNEVMNVGHNEFKAAPFHNGPDTDNGLFYKSAKITWLRQNRIRTSLRDIMEYKLLALGREFSIFSVHFKASSSSSNQQIRLTQAKVLRKYMNDLAPGSNFMLAGDFNMRSSSEAAFGELTADQADNDGRLFDPINKPGTWYTNRSFRHIHSQSTRTTNFGSGASGGLDDRFDMILVSESLLGGGGLDILPATYKSFGNDGNHFNRDINSGSNSAVPDSIANALHQASDHLPVVADFVFDFPTTVAESATEPNSYQLRQNFPNPFNPTTTIEYKIPVNLKIRLSVFNLLGQEVAVLESGRRRAGRHKVAFDAGNLASGVYLVRLAAGKLSYSIKIVLVR